MHALCCTLLKEYAHRLDDDGEIRANAGVLDVDEVVDEFIIRRRIVLSVDLCKPCDAGLDIHPIDIFGDLLLELLDKEGTFRARADNAHIPHENIPNLRKFIETNGTEKCTEAGNSRVIFLGKHGAAQFFRINAHRAEFVYLKWLSIAA